MQLVINTFGASIHKSGDLFEIRVRDRKVPVSALKVRSILITTSAHLSTDAIQLAAQHHIDLVFLDKYGEPYGRFWHSKMGSTATIRRRQLEIAETRQGLDVVVAWIQAKLENQLDFLKDLKRHRPKRQDLFEAPLETMANSLDALSHLQGNLETCRGSVMGHEGAAGRGYFQTLSPLMPEAFRFGGRSRMPAKDEFNAMLNYAYGVLYSHVERACIVAGLDPFVGFLHTDNYNKKSLVFDLIEPFRILAERVVVYLFTGRKVSKEHFRDIQGGKSLSDEGKPVLINALNEELEKTIRWPVGGAYLRVCSAPLPDGQTGLQGVSSPSVDESPAGARAPAVPTADPTPSADSAIRNPQSPIANPQSAIEYAFPFDDLEDEEEEPDNEVVEVPAESGELRPAQSAPSGKTRNIKQRDIIQYEAHALANHLLGGTDLPPEAIETESEDFGEQMSPSTRCARSGQALR